MVVQEGGFEKAANQLCLTQSAISQRIKLLEDRTGKILLSRTSPPQPTEAGRSLIKHYFQVKLLEEGLKEEVENQEGEPIRLSLGINADSLASWFLSAIGDLLEDGKLLVDLHVDDQEQTHKLLRDGVVVGCISDHASPIQGCRVEYLGSMTYRLLARPEFTRKWFPDGLTESAVMNAPAVMFSRKDMLHHKALNILFGDTVHVKNVHYVPSIEQFTEMISSGYAYGMVPDWQADPLRAENALIEINKKAIDSVHLYWHCWNIDSESLKTFSAQLLKGAKKLLAQLC